MQVSHPPKQQVRDYMAKRREERTPPPSPEQIREQLGWKLIVAQRMGRGE